MVNPSTIRSIIGIIGNVISFGLFLSPVPTMWKIYKNKSVQQFSVVPYIATILNCVMWVIYGLPTVNPDHILVVTINGIGLGLEAIYVAIFFFYSTGWCLTRKKITFGLIGEAIFTLIVTMITFYVLHTTKKRTVLMGALCVAFNIIMYISPLTVMKQVITTKSVKYMPFWLSLTNFLNGLCWTAYAWIHFDVWMVVPNGLGAISGMVQLGLYAYYYRTTDWSDGPSDGPKEIELKGDQAV
ncbi:bidirectional sugar transporter SWEET5-like [Silene latifolia]|uniref:bidirectional sugar transporter SWEET5-like n=1 Tax=Silene latifolia TaxID=37657 RepID=UPI003D7736A2